MSAALKGDALPPHGRQGFKDAESAISDARSEIRVSAPVPFAVMRKGDNYGWLMPVPYARRVAEANDVEIVSVEELKP